jgi:transcriptional regulator with XRE-family HTH domain
VAELGEYLKSRRAAIGPADAGLTSSGVRRVPGLRREEVALLAGVSADYYTRLEQGRERSPSVQVLDALAAALRLDDDWRRGPPSRRYPTASTRRCCA